MAAVVIGLIIGLVLVFPTAEFVRFCYAELTGWYGNMTVSDALQALTVVLLTILVARTFFPGQPAETRGPSLRPTPPERRPTRRARTVRDSAPDEPLPPPPTTRTRRSSRAVEEPAEPAPERRRRAGATTTRRTVSRSRVDTEEQETEKPRRRTTSRRTTTRRPPQ